MQENIILCVLGITLKTRHSYSETSSKEQKILGVTIDNKLNFKGQINELCKKTSQKIAALSRLSSYLHKSEKKLIFDSIIKSQF